MRAFVEMDDVLSDRIRRLAETCRQPVDRLILDAIELHAEKLEAQTSFIEEADASWDAYRKDGLHLTGDEVLKWLKGVGTDDEKPLPDCHK